MKKITLSPSFQKQLKQLHKKDAKLFRKIQKQFVLFKSDPHHPSLRLHKLRGELRDVWSLSVTLNFKVLFIKDTKYYFFDMGTHDQVYKK